MTATNEHHSILTVVCMCRQLRLYLSASEKRPCCAFTTYHTIPNTCVMGVNKAPNPQETEEIVCKYRLHGADINIGEDTDGKPSMPPPFLRGQRIMEQNRRI